VSYPVSFEADYAQRRSRLTAFLRLILMIPLAIWLYLYEIAAMVVLVVAWLAVVITGRYPKSLYDFLAGFTRYLARMTAYAVLLCDPYPPFGGGHDPNYPVRMEFAGPAARYSRLKAFFRFILAIPIAILRWAIALLLEVSAVGAWFVIVITGNLPRGLFDLMVLANSYIARSDAYLFLLTETYPPFQDEHTRSAGLSTQPAAGSASRY
jgi:Domain of unknown function (DUF4389)